MRAYNFLLSPKMAEVPVLTLCLSLVLCAFANPEQGKWTFTLDQNTPFAVVARHMYQDSKVTVSADFLSCEGEESGYVEVSWLLRMSPCALEYASLVELGEQQTNFSNKKVIENYQRYPVLFPDMPYSKVELLRDSMMQTCLEDTFKLVSEPEPKVETFAVPQLSKTSAGGSSEQGSSDKQAAPPAPPPASAGDAPAQTRKKREEPNDPQSTSSPATPAAQPGTASPQQKLEGSVQKESESQGSNQQDVATSAQDLQAEISAGVESVDHQVLARTWVDGNYLFILNFKPGTAAKFRAQVTIRMFYGDNNYISALDYPLLIFYGILGLVYILFSLVWLLLLACNWRDLLRVQLWIGGVICLGMLEKAVFFAEYEQINKTGESGHGTLIMAELVSSMKRTLARMLVIIVSLGYGIVKPRLGQAFQKVLFVGGVFFILSAVEGCMRTTRPSVNQSSSFLVTAVPLVVLDTIICWWIFSSLVQTTRALRLRRNVVKLSLYRHFTNALVFNVLSSIAYMVWSVIQHKFNDCIKDWKQLWVDEAFWHVLFVVLLFVVMILWRPSANNQRFAFSPLLDAADEEEDEGVMNDAFDGMKMRGMKNGSPKRRDSSKKLDQEEDLKWVEENIPSSIADKALPSFLDSDEEQTNTLFEMSKME